MDKRYDFESVLNEFLTQEVGAKNFWFKPDAGEDGVIGILHVWGEKFKENDDA